MHMTAFSDLYAKKDQLLILWTRPRFPPYHYKQTTSCRLLCEQKTYYLTEFTLNGALSSSTVYSLWPGSVCVIKLVAVYNPASIDPGIGLSAHTLLSSKASIHVYTYIGCENGVQACNLDKNICVD